MSLLPTRRRDTQTSIQPLRQHCIRHLHEPRDIRTIDVVDAAIGLLAMLHAVDVDLLQDHVQAFVHHFQGGGHVGAFGHAQGAVVHEGAGVAFVQFVLGGAGQGDVGRDVPGAAAFEEFEAFVAGQFGQAAAAFVLQRHHVLHRLFVEAVAGVEGAAGVGEGEYLAAEFGGFE